MSAIQFFVRGDPKGQPRPRAFAFHGKARVYDPGTAEGWKNMIAIAAKPYQSQAIPEAAVELTVTFFFKRPKSHFKPDGMLKDKAPIEHLQKPDGDNLAKAVLDTLTVLGFWKDDCQVVSLSVEKLWQEPNYDSGAFITIEYR